ncbi:RNA polymerase sigma factor [Spirillospora sp. NPDC029432]|uniref:RNA polymerase sigma factor n=1 Tax=Spirillospora sp. NPDC029432 TaxID=3154599 RepID=UPI003454769E
MKDRAAPGRELEAALRDAQAGDEAAFRTLYRDLQPRLLRYLRALVDGEAEDVAADAWLQIARDLGSFKGDYDRFRGWATTIARHRALDHLRRLGRRPDASVHIDEVTGLTGADDTERDALERLSTGAAVALICGLPRDQAEAVLLRVVVGLDAKEAGRVLGKRSGAVRTAAYRGLRRLAERLAEHPGPPEELGGTSPSEQAGAAGGAPAARGAGGTAAEIGRQPSGARGAPPPDAAR